jgi:hypothetical protein
MVERWARMRGMDDTELPTLPATGHDHALELRREAYTMGLYVAICLLAVLTAAVHHDTISQGDVFELIWGTTLGLALAHWFAFRLSSRMVRSGRMHKHDVDTGAAQFAGAALVGLLASIPVVLLDTQSELDAARLVLAGFIGIVGYSVARSNGASRPKAIAYGVAELIVAASVAILKNTLSGY